MMDLLICSNCGSANISPGSIQRGIGGEHWLGLCFDCAPKIPKMPLDSDHSAKAERLRRSIEVKTQIGTYRTKLTPLVRPEDYRPKAKAIPADPMSLWDDGTLT